MGIDTKFGRVTTEKGSIGEDEPVFVLRGTDAFGLGTISDYTQRVHAALRNGDLNNDQAKDLLSELALAQDSFQTFAVDNPDQMRIPGTRTPDEAPAEEEPTP